MPQSSFRLPRAISVLALAAAMFTVADARADEYGDVSQLIQTGKFADAMARADKFLADKPRDPQMRFLKGMVQAESGRANDAIVTFTKLTEDFPNLPEPYNNLAVLHASQGQYDKARMALEGAIRTNPSYATAHENLGDLYARLAGAAYSKALQLDGSNQAVAPKLALIRDLFTPGQRPPAPRGASPAASMVAMASSPAAARPASSRVATGRVAAASAASAPAVAAVPAASAAARPASAPAVASAAASAPASADAARSVESAVRAWAAAWAAKDVPAYLGAYGREFQPAGGASRDAWEAERKARIVGKQQISVRIMDLAVTVNGDKAVAKFKQAYSAGALNMTSPKTLELVKAGTTWAIVRERTGA